MDYEIIIGTGEPDDNQLAVAKAVESAKDFIEDASIWRVDIYDGGGVGLNISTDQELGMDMDLPDSIESVQEISVTPIE